MLSFSKSCRASDDCRLAGTLTEKIMGSGLAALTIHSGEAQTLQ